MAKKAVAVPTWARLGGPAKVSEVANLVQGVFVGVNSSGEVLPATPFGAQGSIQARGFVTDDVQRKDPKGTVVNTDDRVAYATEGVISGFDNPLVPGATYYLNSGGGISVVPVGSWDQSVGWAKNAQELVVHIGAVVASGSGG